MMHTKQGWAIALFVKSDLLFVALFKRATKKIALSLFFKQVQTLFNDLKFALLKEQIILFVSTDSWFGILSLLKPNSEPRIIKILGLMNFI